MFKHIKSELEVTENLENPNSGWVLGLKSIKIELEIKPCVHERITKFKISIQNENFYIMFFGDFLILLFIQNAHLKVLCFLQSPSKIVLFHDFIDIQMQPKYSK